MSTLPERPLGTNAADPASSPEKEKEGPTKPPWKASDPIRWAHLNLEDPDPSDSLPKGARVPDALAHALICPGAIDPVEGIVDGVRVELAAMADAFGERPVAGAVRMMERRLGVAMLLLRWTDNREQLPWEDDFDEEPPAPPPPEEPPPEESRQAATPTHWSEASLATVLLYGLTLGPEDPALGVLLGARRELRLVESLAEAATGPSVEFDVDEIAPVIESIGRRLDVAIELFNRAQQARTASNPPGRGPEDAQP